MRSSQLLIKVCGLREKLNIYEVSNLNPSFLGFIYYPASKRYVGDNFIIPSDIAIDQKKVAVLVNESIENSVTIFKKGFDFLQLHGNETPDHCEILYNFDIPIIKAFGVDEYFDFDKLKLYEPFVKYFLFDTKSSSYGGTGKKFNWNILDQYTLETPFLLSGGITKDDTEEILNFKHPALIGVDINSGFEVEPALKNINDLEYFFRKISEK